MIVATENFIPLWIASVAVTTACIFAFIVLVMGKASPADARAVCAKHNGVQQVAQRWSGKESAFIVCRDGWVGGL